MEKTNNNFISFFKKGLDKTLEGIGNIKGFYVKKFHSKWYASLVYGVTFILALFGVIVLNIAFMKGGKFSMSEAFSVLANWTDDRDGTISSVNLTFTEFQQIQVGWYNIAATILAGVGMSLAAVATQSLTRNPIAEGSTLGLVQAAIFGIIFALSFGLSSLLEKYLMAIIFASVGASLLLVFILYSKKNNSGPQKIILAGLAIGIIFKTITFIMKAGDQNANTVSFAYTLGGAESISGETLALGHDKINITLLVAAILIISGIIVAIVNIKGMNLLEIGDERAKNLGSSVMLTRILNVLVVLLALPAAVMIAGNMAFLGLFAVHLARWTMKSRNYKKVLPITILIGMLMASIGMQLSQHMPQINSGIWMTFIGAPYLIYVGIRGLK